MKNILIFILVCTNINLSYAIQKNGLFEVFWLHDAITFTNPPIRSVTDYVNADGTPQIDVLTISCVKFNNDVKEPYFNMTLINMITPEDIKYIKSRGITVLLSVIGTYGTGDKNIKNDGMGWSCIPPKENVRFAKWIKKHIIDHWNFDGIDIDDEYYGCDADPKLLNRTVHVMRKVLGDDIIIKKDLFEDFDVIPMIKDVLDYGTTMEYGNSFNSLINTYNNYKNLGLRDDQLMIGIQAGPVKQGAFASIEVAKKITLWQPNKSRIKPQKKGVMLFSFSQDTQQFTHSPQHSKQYPDKDDHKWQKTIAKNMYN